MHSPLEHIKLVSTKAQIYGIRNPSSYYAEKEFWGTYIVQDNADEDIERNAEKVHDCASGFFRDVLGSHLHYGWPKQSYTCLKYTEPKELKATRERDSSTFYLGGCYEQLSHTPDCKQLISHRIKVKTSKKDSQEVFFLTYSH